MTMFGYNFKLNWKGENVQVAAGNFSADVDTKAVTSILTAVGSVTSKDVSLLMNLSAASLATCVAVLGVKKVWNWLEASDPPESDILQVMVHSR